MDAVYVMDRRDLLGWRTDINSKAFLKEYARYRKVWEYTQKGGLPREILLLLAAKHQKVEKPVETSEVKPTESEKTKPKARNTKPKPKEAAVA